MSVEADDAYRRLAVNGTSDTRSTGNAETAAQLDCCYTLVDQGFGCALGLCIVGDTDDGEFDLRRPDRGRGAC